MKKVFVVLQFERLYNRYKRYKRSTNHMWVQPKMNLVGQVALYLLPAMIIFIFFPAMLFTYFEGWDYSISVYYAFVTLTTIGRRFSWLNLSNCKRAFHPFSQGFGDYVPTFQPHQERTFGIYFVFYQLFILVWFIVGTFLTYIIRA